MTIRQLMRLGLIKEDNRIILFKHDYYLGRGKWYEDIVQIHLDIPIDNFTWRSDNDIIVHVI